MIDIFENKNDFKDARIEVRFYRRGKKYYFLFNDKEYECNSTSISELKQHLILPCKIKVLGMSRAQLGRILSSLLNTAMTVKIKKISRKNSVLEFEALFLDKKKIFFYSSDEKQKAKKSDNNTDYNASKKYYKIK